MRITVSIHLACRTFHGIRRIPSVIAIAAGVMCLLMGAEIHRTVKAEKAEPCEITAVSMQGSLDREIMGPVTRIEGAEAVTYVWDMPGRLQFEEYRADVTLYGVAASYPEGEWIFGKVFPEHTAMPYLVLNEAAARGFRNDEALPPENADSIRWDEETVKLDDGTGRAVRICGIWKDGQDSPRAYMSVDQIKTLRMNAGMESPAETLLIRLTDSGVREDVIRALAEIHLAVASGDERESSWTLRTERSVLYIRTGCVSMLCGLALTVFAERLWQNEAEGAVKTLELFGVPPAWPRRLACMRWILTAVLGIVCGITAMIFL